MPMQVIDEVVAFTWRGRIAEEHVYIVCQGRRGSVKHGDMPMDIPQLQPRALRQDAQLFEALPADPYQLIRDRWGIASQ